jgi:hypothetical protein
MEFAVLLRCIAALEVKFAVKIVPASLVQPPQIARKTKCVAGRFARRIVPKHFVATVTVRRAKPAVVLALAWKVVLVFIVTTMKTAHLARNVVVGS